MIESPRTVYYFGDVQLDVSNFRLTVLGEVRPLEPKSFRLLQFLIENRQRVVPKDEILRVVWEGVAVSDNALTRAIAQIRKALNDDPKQPRYIETVPTVGYRFLRELQQGEQVVSVAEKESTRVRPLVWAVAAIAMVAVGIGTAYLSRPVVQPHAVGEPLPLTTYPGGEWYPNFSPDGNQIAFTWTGEHDDNFDIYVKAFGSESPLRLTTDPERDYRPRWSPEGRRIAFERVSADGRISILLISPLGGPERKLVEFRSHRNEAVSRNAPNGTSWSPDGTWLAVSGDQANRGYDRILLVRAGTGEVRELTHPASPEWGDYFPAFSPDGRALLFVRQKQLLPGRIYRVPLDGNFAVAGEPRELPIGEHTPTEPTWMADGRDILFIATGVNDTNGFGPLYRMRVDGASLPAKLEGTASVTSFGLSRDGGRLAYSVASLNSNIWRLDLARWAKDKNTKPQRLIASTRREVFPQYSPDGKRIAFCSNRAGSYEIWVSDADGSRAAAITSVNRRTTGAPRWSPDGRTLAFDSNSTGVYQIYTVSADGGPIRQVTTGPGSNFGASWSRDGSWIYFASDAGGVTQLWKIPSQGGAAVQVTRYGGQGAIESPDGKSLYYAKPTGKGSFWKMPVGGGAEELVVDTTFRFNYAVTGTGVYITRDNSIDFVDFATREIRQVLKIPQPDFGVTISPDGRYLLFSQIDARGSDLMLVENFR